MFGRLILIMVLLCVFIVGFVIFDGIDRATNYTTVDAEVISVKQRCYLQKSERGLFTKTTSTTEQGPCDEMERIWKSHPAYAGYQMHRDVMVKFEYRSPVDEMGHVVERKLAEARAKSLHPYDHIQVLAHKRNAEQTKWL